MRLPPLLVTVAAACALATSAHADPITTYLYDPNGRMLAATDAVNIAGGVLSLYANDAADNRTLRAKGGQGRANYDRLNAYESLIPGEALVSPDGRFAFGLQADGNLVLYWNSGVLWASNVATGATLYAGMGADGVFAAYDPTYAELWRIPHTTSAGAYLRLQNDGNLVLYDSGGSPIWDTGTGGH